MIIYRILNGGDLDPGENADYAGTLGEAHMLAKQRFQGLRSLARIEQHDIATDKGSVIVLLIDGVGAAFTDSTLRQTWGLSPRGGLVQLENGQ